MKRRVKPLNGLYSIASCYSPNKYVVRIYSLSQCLFSNFRC